MQINDKLNNDKLNIILYNIYNKSYEYINDLMY